MIGKCCEGNKQTNKKQIQMAEDGRMGRVLTYMDKRPCKVFSEGETYVSRLKGWGATGQGRRGGTLQADGTMELKAVG